MQKVGSAAVLRESEVRDGMVQLCGVTKRFRRQVTKPKSYQTLKSLFFGKERVGLVRKDIFTALDNVSVTVKPGTALGVIGRNGSGKSTMLKLISGIYQPDGGEVRRKGRISALIELGAGFHPDFSGRENIYLGGVMYGLSRREIDKRFDDIVQYAELVDYIDDPVRTYSSGMYMRLGFSLAVFTEPDILLIDEVLAVGDASFVHRCHDTISDFRRRGKTLIFVTHDLSSVVRWCDEAIWLERGKIVKKGEPRFVIDSYLQEIEKQEDLALKEANTVMLETSPELAKEQDGADLNDVVISSANESSAEAELFGGEDLEVEKEVTRWGNGDVDITEVKMFCKNGEEKWIFHDEEGVIIEVHYQIKEPIEDLVFGIGILRADGLTVHGSNTDIDRVKIPIPNVEEQISGSSACIPPHKGTYRFEIDRLGLVDDTYFLDVAAHKTDGTPYDYHHRRHKFSVRNQSTYHGVYNPRHSWSFEVKKEG